MKELTEIEKGHSEFIQLSNISKEPIMLVELRDYKTNKLEQKFVIIGENK